MADKDEEKETKSLISRLLESAVMFAIAAFLIRLGVVLIQDIWPALVIIVTLISIGIVIYRIWKKRKETKW